MNITQKQLILDHLEWLCQNTMEEYTLSSCLLVEGFVTEMDHNAIVVGKHRSERVYTLINKLVKMNKPNSFFGFLNCLRKSNNGEVAQTLELRYRERMVMKRMIEGIKLERFLIPHLPMLCEGTINQAAIARQLVLQGFIADKDYHTVLEHPDDYCKNAELYKIFQCKCNYGQMISILRDTGNEKMANRLEEL